MKHLLCVEQYEAGSFKQFFKDPRTRAEYVKWVRPLLAAEKFVHGLLKPQVSTPEFCEVVESNCIAPPAHRTDFGAVLESDRKVRTTCFKCGRPACKACSRLVTNGGNSSGPRNKRVCVECLAEMKRDAARVT